VSRPIQNSLGVAADNGGYHAFLPMPRRLADAVVLAAASEGVELTDPASLTVRDVLSRCAMPSASSFS
jgi:hypothetical protein